ncbi:MAG: hypothetical protein JWO82_1132 [Akkermansiaceae bacterium]|nr:hypothetical protein [Akkermansiaceae bacterium]
MKKTLWFLGLLPGALCGAITVSGVADKSYYTGSATFTIAADAGFAFIANLDGAPVAVGSAVTSQLAGFHDLEITKTPAGGGTSETLSLRFIIQAPGRGGAEAGLPAWTPHAAVADPPSSFTGSTLNLIAPSHWPKDSVLPVVARLTGGDGEGLRLNGKVVLSGVSERSFPLRRGWGSRLLPAVSAGGTIDLAANVQGLAVSRPVVIEDSPSWTDAGGVLSTNTMWPVNSRIHLTGDLTIAAGNTLEIGAGSIVQIDPGVEIIADGTLQVDGNLSDPVVFMPRSGGQVWGGIELNVATSRVNASGAFFTGAGGDASWFGTHPGYASHRGEQALFLIGAAGAELHTDQVWIFDLAGQVMNSRAGAVIDLKRTLIQRCVTGGELSGSTVTIDRSALIEIPSDTPEYIDGDNDALYVTNGIQTIRNTVIGWTKDDGIDSGDNGGAGTVTTLENNWYESIFHEGQALSGVRNVAFNGCVFIDCGQGIEDGYGSPVAIADGCLFSGNLVGARFGDNYNWGYGGSLEVKNSHFAGNFYHDVWGYDWSSWTYNVAPVFNVHDNQLSIPDAVHHPLNTTPVDGSLLAPLMPKPGADVGIAVLPVAGAATPGSYPGTFTLRLSGFSSRQAGATWTLLGSNSQDSPLSPLATGSVVFSPGETLKEIAAPLADPGSYAKLAVSLSAPEAAVVTAGDLWFLNAPAVPFTLIQERAADRHVLRWQGSGAVLERSDDLLNWKALPEAASPAEIEPAIGVGPFFRLRY